MNLFPSFGDSVILVPVKSGLWLSQRQVRWLIVLLALLPLIPSVLLVQMMVQSAMRDRDGAVAEITGIYRNQLGLIIERFSDERTESDGEALIVYLRRIFGDDISLSVLDEKGMSIRDLPFEPTRDAIIYEIAGGKFRGWTVSLDGVPVFPDHIEAQRKETWWHAVAIMTVVILVAGGVWFTVHRRLRVDALRSDLLTTISHEIKTPVAAMKVLIETLEGGSQDEETVADYIELLGKENERIGELANQFLTISRLERGQVTIRQVDCRLKGLLEEQAELFRPQFESVGGGVNCLCSDDVVVRTDPQALKVVVANLLQNALNYGGEPPRAKISVEEDPGQCRILVSDGGAGIAASDRRAVFQRFYRGDAQLNQGKVGVGLGLAICRRFMKLLKGKIYLENSGEGEGARFVVSLPFKR